MAGRFGPDGRVAEHKTSGLYVEIPALTRIMQWFCAPITTMRGPACWRWAQHFTNRLVMRRRFDCGEGGTSSADFLDDLVGFGVPDEGLGVVVPVLDPKVDGVD
jgi:hypothetical protein